MAPPAPPLHLALPQDRHVQPCARGELRPALPQTDRLGRRFWVAKRIATFCFGFLFPRLFELLVFVCFHSCLFLLDFLLSLLVLCFSLLVDLFFVVFVLFRSCFRSCCWFLSFFWFFPGFLRLFYYSFRILTCFPNPSQVVWKTHAPVLVQGIPKQGPSQQTRIQQTLCQCEDFEFNKGSA